MLEIYHVNSALAGIPSYPGHSSLVWTPRFFYSGGWFRWLMQPTPKVPPLSSSWKLNGQWPQLLSSLNTPRHPLVLSYVICPKLAESSSSELPQQPSCVILKDVSGHRFWVHRRFDWGQAVKPQPISSNKVSSFIVCLVDMSLFKKNMDKNKSYLDYAVRFT